MAALDRRTVLALAAGVLVSPIVEARGRRATPSTIMLIRHAEDVNLSPRGFERARALPRLFGGRVPVPQAIIATRASKNSNRPIETAEPLARALHLSIDNRFKDDDFALRAHSASRTRRDGLTRSSTTCGSLPTRRAGLGSTTFINGSSTATVRSARS